MPFKRVTFIFAVMAVHYVLCGNRSSHPKRTRKSKKEEILDSFEIDTKALMKSARRPESLEWQLHRAVVFGHVPIVEALLAAGANANGGECEGAKPLHTAVNNPQYKLFDHYQGARIVELLTSFEADVNALNDNAESPIDVMKDEWNAGTLTVILINAGADVSNLRKILFNLRHELPMTLLKNDAESLDDYLRDLTNEYLHGCSSNVLGRWIPAIRIQLYENMITFPLYRISVEMYSKRDEPSLWESRKLYVINYFVREIARGTYMNILPSKILRDAFLFTRLGWKMESLAWNTHLASYKLERDLDEMKIVALELLKKKFGGMFGKGCVRK